jgi:2-keto-4-pentenoate hydratase/2-oxohepta-3-ene-1,7-dioic acid hydratase in catechol pathway
MDHVAGYCVVNDVSERAFQMERGQTMIKGKGAETIGPMGQWHVTKDEIKDPQNLRMWATVNGEKRQNGTTKTMVFGVAHLVWYLSQFFVLEAGDVIATGTPPGVGFARNPPVFLKPGDKMEVLIEGMGDLGNPVVSESQLKQENE